MGPAVSFHLTFTMTEYIKLLLILGLALTSSVNAQGRIVSGRVVDETSGKALGGARVILAGATSVTQSDGSFRIAAPAPSAADAFRVVLIGYSPVQRQFDTRDLMRDVTIAMTRVPLGLDDVVVTGTAGPTRLRAVGHSIAQIQPSQINEPQISMDNLLTGKVPGVSVLMSGGNAGSGSQIRLRGNASVALSNQPLVYVDGIRVRSDGYPKNQPLSGDTRRNTGDVPSPLNDIDPTEVERVEIVRGPAATTLFGTEAAAGVIQIFTRRGVPGEQAWNAQFQMGADHVQKFGTDAEPYLRLEPWLRTARRMGYSLSTSGGKAARYFVSTSLQRNDGVLPNDSERRVGLRTNLDFNITDKLAIAWSSAYTDNDLRNTPAGPGSQGLTLNAFRGDRNYTGVTGTESISRVLAWDITTGIKHFIGGATAVYTVSPQHSQSVTVGYDKARADMVSLRPFGFVFAPAGILSEERWLANTFTASYLGRAGFRVVPNVGATLSWGAQSVTTDVESVAGYAEGFTENVVPAMETGAQTQYFESRSRAINAGFFSQVVVDFRDRYFLTVGMRLDGNSSFGKDFGLQPYPRLNASYVISDESFWPRAAGTMKLRAAYGHAGRAPRVFDAERSWVQTTYDGKPAFLPQAVGNPLLGPERSAESELGFDAASKGGRLNASFTWYRRRIEDALFPVTQAASLGFLGSKSENVGTVQSSGLEIALFGPVFTARRFSLDLGLNVATHKSNVVSLGTAPRFAISETGWIEEGSPAPVVRGMLLRNPNELAEPVIERNHAFGPNVPTHTVGARGTLHLPGRIELDARAEFVGGNFMLDRVSRHLASNSALFQCASVYPLLKAGQVAGLTAWERVWCNPAKIPEDGPVYPADFVRLRNFSLSVPLPGKVFQSNRATLVLSARNYLLWKHRDFLVFDPEMAGRDGMHSIDRNVDAQVPPTAGLSFAIRAVYR